MKLVMWAKLKYPVATRHNFWIILTFALENLDCWNNLVLGMLKGTKLSRSCLKRPKILAEANSRKTLNTRNLNRLPGALQQFLSLKDMYPFTEYSSSLSALDPETWLLPHRSSDHWLENCLRSLIQVDYIICNSHENFKAIMYYV